MSVSIRSNSASLRAQRILGRTSEQLSATLQRLSSGERINRASDDAGGLSISESLKARAKISAKGIRNSQDGISALNIADAALGEITNILGRMSELAEQSANGTLSNDQRATLNKEFRSLGLEIQRITETTTFNGAQLILQRPFNPAPDVLELEDNSIIDLPDSISVAAYTYAPTDYPSNSIVLQVGSNSSSASRITTTSINASITGLGLGNYYSIDGPPSEYVNVNIRNASEARTALTKLSSARDTVTTYRGQVGATQSRLTTAMNGLSVAEENLLAANSRIRSADYATESAQLTRLSITQNAATAVLAQANQQPALALTLLQG